MKKDNIVCSNFVKATKEVVKWNSWDFEHLTFVHNQYSRPQELLRSKNIGLFIDSIKLPVLPIRLKVMVFCAQISDEIQVSYVQTVFGLFKNSIECIERDENTEVKVNYQMSGNYFQSLFFPIIKRYLQNWNQTVWDEDLPVKLRRQKALEYGFIDYRGLPIQVSKRKDRSGQYKAAIPGSVDGLVEDPHAFFEKF